MANSESEQIWLAAVKLEAENGELRKRNRQRVNKLVRLDEFEHPFDRLWPYRMNMSSSSAYRELYCNMSANMRCQKRDPLT